MPKGIVGKKKRAAVVTASRAATLPGTTEEDAMTITNTQTGTRIDEVGEGLYRISTPVPPAAMPGGFSFNQYLLVDDEPLLFHTGQRRNFPLLREAIMKVLPIERLR